MTKKIDTIVEDIEELLVNGKTDIPDEDIIDFGMKLAGIMAERLGDRERRGTLRMSNIGKPCTRQLYYEVNNTDEKEEFRPEVYMKFLYGDLIEELVLFLAKQAGHTVEGQQDEQEIAGVLGHRDVVLDGTVADVKSASPFSFKKFAEGRLAEDDAFGYIDQLQSYIYTGQDDPIVTDKDRGAFLVLDKVSGKLCLDIHEREEYDIEAAYEYKKDLVASDEPPARGFDPLPDGKSGNMKLGLNCSYCDFKNKCHPELRTFLYSNGPRFLTETVKEPKVPEVIDGEIVLPEDKG